MNKTYIYLIVGMLITASCTKQSEETNSASESRVLDSDVPIYTRLEKKNITEVIECTGRIDVPPNQRAALYAPIGGNISNIRILPGDQVKKGQILFNLAHQDIIKIQENYLIAKNENNLSKLSYERKKKLYEANSASEKELLLARRDYEVANAIFQSLDAQLKFIGISPEKLENEGILAAIMIKAPIDGYISKIEAVSGAYIDRNNLILTIVDPAHKHVELDIYADKVKNLKVGQKLGFHTAGSDIEFEADIYLIGKEVDEETRTVSVHAHLHDEESNNLIVGSYLYASVKISADEVYSVPDEAIVKVEGKSFILIRENEGLAPFQVEVGETFNGFTQIVNYKDVLNADIVARDAFYYYE